MFVSFARQQCDYALLFGPYYYFVIIQSSVDLFLFLPVLLTSLSCVCSVISDISLRGLTFGCDRATVRWLRHAYAANETFKADNKDVSEIVILFSSLNSEAIKRPANNINEGRGLISFLLADYPNLLKRESGIKRKQQEPCPFH